MSSKKEIRARSSTFTTMLALAFVATMAGATAAQDYREDPFQPNSSANEQRKAAERAKLKEAIRELFPEIRSEMIQPELSASKSQVLEEAKRAAVSAIRTDPELASRLNAIQTQAAQAGQGGGNGVTAIVDTVSKAIKKPTMPEGARFIACLNGKPLYRDVTNSINFFREVAPGSASPCEPADAVDAEKALPAAPLPAAPQTIAAGGPQPSLPPQPGGGMTMPSNGVQRTSMTSPNPARTNGPNR